MQDTMAETIPQFYKRIQRCDPKLDATYSKGKEYFNIFSRRCNFGTVQFSYRDFYKVTLIMGIGKLYYADPLAELNKRIFKSANRFVVNVVYILKDCKCTYFP